MVTLYASTLRRSTATRKGAVGLQHVLGWSKVISILGGRLLPAYDGEQEAND